MSEAGTPLRRGWTTGACATAATKAAYAALLTGAFPDPVAITLPGGQQPAFALAVERLGDGVATAGVIKDAGDDPDVTHGALVLATVRRAAPGAGVVFRAGEGVGTVTLPGLQLPVGEPAINPVPRRLMRGVVSELAASHGDPGDVIVEIGVEGGEQIATRTWNARLGILGGLSILGTTGVVVPYSCSAWIASIRHGIDVARATGQPHAIAATGDTSERAAQRLYELPPSALLDMGDFAGALLKYLARNPVPRLTLAGGVAKLSKLAAGHLDLHSARSQVDLDRLAGWALESGGSATLADEIRAGNTALHAHQLAVAAGVPLAERIAAEALGVVRGVLGTAPVAAEVLVVDREGEIVAHAGRVRPFE
ncbi:cobalt-precorrin-5B (C(1))-methyltransferase [Conexibacter sp. JD483]|uniref:cobalt-precorrin-5B (C(1))-methyltransferase n=1 Tax=unclassified Conexibacter TaxID=2627773 RepID=UPI0027190010|nr:MULTISPECIES: cobalt-precorrin-5B (C(1))-methyltransferase [unclassified Conexibacter]MDO8189339.1 cobalt-precorrin-5B (C(1))-methyltransferase [Conexibacter sp. CPCC 205706]MDO8201398.1 cobalt-precorrin-5B (C(1))-methyltransferase [Conexibacter sp. CPCC 205762]MDR9372396.1 cobalt-precorrin-5B (C(1))-methyltransferase [Conexibacter sp. JD483]